MSYTPVFDPVALSEYEKAVAWYKERSETAAQNLVTEVNERIKGICLNPLRYRNTYKHFRKISLKKHLTILFILQMKMLMQLLFRLYTIIKEIQKRNIKIFKFINPAHYLFYCIGHPFVYCNCRLYICTAFS